MLEDLEGFASIRNGMLLFKSQVVFLPIASIAFLVEDSQRLRRLGLQSLTGRRKCLSYLHAE